MCWLNLYGQVNFYSVVPVPLSNCVAYILNSSKDQLVELSVPYVLLMVFCFLSCMKLYRDLLKWIGDATEVS